ncbi:Aspartic peptidase domain [Pseudocohnilembus persalinus]|uniref:Aspartic peptidase domain n=1 Tax=Pseudocohnilembus persalinus TaxID=266149 RepID=A0A0V0QNT8_PSEPJ|nr:Aspartic peptidase domain [Pseudocohnilembus persalinus]|eukprot:KRX03761.1 Aspartic peptidase domain [Pseudocohnilembus persalinus]
MNLLGLLKKFILINVLIYITNCYKSHDFNAYKLKQSAQQLDKNVEQSKQNDNNGQTFYHLDETNSTVSNNNGTNNSTIITLNQYTLELNQIPAYQQYLKKTTDQNLDIQKIGNKIQFALCNTMQDIQWLLSDGILGFNYQQVYSDSGDTQYVQQGILSQLHQENKSNKKSFSLYLDFKNDNNFYNQQIEQNKIKLNDFGYYNFTQLDNEASTSNLIIGGYNSQYLNLQDFYYINLKNRLTNQNETNNTSSQTQKDENKNNNFQQYELDAKLQSIIVDNQFEIKLEQNLDNQTIILDPNTFYSELTEEFIVQLIKILENTQGIHCFVGQYSKFLQCDYPYKKYDQYKNQFPDFALKINDKQIYIKGKLFQGQCYNQTTGFKFDYIRQNTNNTQTTQNQKGNNTEADTSTIPNNSQNTNNTDNSTQNNNTGNITFQSQEIPQNNNKQENDTIEQKHNFLKRENNQIKKYQSNYQDDTIKLQNQNKIQENVAINSDQPINEKNKDKLISYKNYEYSVCYLNLRQSQNNDILLGRNFFYQYYTYFDLEQMKLGIKDISII